MFAEPGTTIPAKLRQRQIFRSAPMTADREGSTALAAKIRAFWIFNTTAWAAHFTSLIATRASLGGSEHQHNPFSDGGSIERIFGTVLIYPVPQNAPYMSAGMNVLNSRCGQCPKL